MTTQPIESTYATYPTLSRRQALNIFVASVIAMSVGWILGAYIPLWLAPPAENLTNTFFLYALMPCLLWGSVPVLLFRLWKIRLSADALIHWITRYVLLFSLWLIILVLVFNRGYGNNVFFEMTLSIFSETHCSSEIAENGNITYICAGGISTTATCADEDYIYLYGGFDAVGLGCPHQYTFEGREGLPFVWYTGEIIPEENDDD